MQTVEQTSGFTVMTADALIDEAAEDSFPASDPPTYMAGAIPGAPFRAAADDRHIRERAYFLWQQEGCPDGRAHDHWCAAERLEADRRVRKP